MTLGRCPLSIYCSRGTPPKEVPRVWGPSMREPRVLFDVFDVMWFRVFKCFHFMIAVTNFVGFMIVVAFT